MPVIVMGVKLAAYLACIALALKFVNMLCSNANKRYTALAVPTILRSLIASLIAFAPLATILFITISFAAITDGSPMSILGLTYNSHSFPFIYSGAALGFICVVMVFLFGVLGGFIKIKHVDTSEPSNKHLPEFFGGLADYLGGSILEEVVTRGYMFYLISSVLGGEIAIIGSSLIFALIHLIRPDKIPLIFTLNAFIFGLITGACRCYTGHLWLPIGLHFGWNVTAGPILGLPYSGVTYERGIFKCEVSGPEWFTGGLYSLDAGVLGTFSLLIAVIGLRLIAPVI